MCHRIIRGVPDEHHCTSGRRADSIFGRGPKLFPKVGQVISFEPLVSADMPARRRCQPRVQHERELAHCNIVPFDSDIVLHSALLSNRIGYNEGVTIAHSVDRGTTDARTRLDTRFSGYVSPLPVGIRETALMVVPRERRQ